MGRRRQAARAAAAEAAAAVVAESAARTRALTGVEMILDDYRMRRAGHAGDLDPFSLPIVVACRQLIADTVGQLPLVTYDPAGQPLATQPGITVRPDPFEPRWLTMHRLVNNLTGPGHVWLLPTSWYADGRWPQSVQVVDASRASPTFDPVTGRLESAWYDGRDLSVGDDIMWVPWRVDRPGSPGVGPLGDCRRAVEYLAALWEMAGSFWESGFPSIAVVIQQALTAAQRAEVKAEVIESWRRRHEPTVVDRNADLKALAGTAVESQLVESIEVANVEIARAFGVMPSIVNVRASDSLTYATTEGEFDKWLKVGLGNYLMRIEAVFSDLRPHGQTCRFATAELLRSDLSGRYAAYAIALNRWLTSAEIRAAEGLAPLSADQFAAMPPPSPLTESPIGAPTL